MQPKAAPQDEEEDDDAATDCWHFKEFKRDAGAREPAGFCSNQLWNILESERRRIRWGRRVCVVLDGITQMCQSPERVQKLLPAVLKQPVEVKAARRTCSSRSFNCCRWKVNENKPRLTQNRGTNWNEPQLDRSSTCWLPFLRPGKMKSSQSLLQSLAWSCLQTQKQPSAKIS